MIFTGLCFDSFLKKSEAWILFNPYHHHARAISIRMRADKGNSPVSEQLQSPDYANSGERKDYSSSLEGTELSASRGKVNEIDFCLAPNDVSLSRAYNRGSTTAVKETDNPIMSLTRALNNASNRAVRRILLARSRPSAEALNVSLKRVAEMEKLRNEDKDGKSDQKCPVPRPILNVLTRGKRRQQQQGWSGPNPRTRTDEEYIQDQLTDFKERYGDLAGYIEAENYLKSILCLATSGIESEKTKDVMSDGVYDESYNRVLSVLKSVGVEFEESERGDRKIKDRLADEDFCLSMLDKVGNVVPAASPSNDTDGLNNDDLGGVLLSATQPTMTRQLNVLANIVQRALLFGGDQELLVLAETLDADRIAFVERWYPSGSESSLDDLSGVQFLDSMIALLRKCYEEGIVTTLDPIVKLSASYENAYERLVALAVELGSGYLKPEPDTMKIPPPRTATEELGRFAVWETKFRQNGMEGSTSSPYPDDLLGEWEVRDVVGGESIGVSTVQLGPDGKVTVKEPLEGLRWRLDPGPTHLDTCTFQVLGSDGTILQYRGFLDRGARLEARFSKRSLSIRGSVMFQMRDGSVDYYKDMLPINYRTGTTKFVMKKIEKT